jgi:hypothetical protein
MSIAPLIFTLHHPSSISSYSRKSSTTNTTGGRLSRFPAIKTDIDNSDRESAVNCALLRFSHCCDIVIGWTAYQDLVSWCRLPSLDFKIDAFEL